MVSRLRGSDPVCSCNCVPMPTQHAIPLGLVNEYQWKRGTVTIQSIKRQIHSAICHERIRGAWWQKHGWVFTVAVSTPVSVVLQLRLVSGGVLMKRKLAPPIGPWHLRRTFQFHY